MKRILAAFLLILGFTNSAVHAQSAEESKLAQRAYEVMKSRCYRCHGGASRNANLDVLDRRSLMETKITSYDMLAVVPKKPDDSAVWSSIDLGVMPQNGSKELEQMSEDEKSTIKQWIEAGAPPWAIRKVRFIGNSAIYKAVRQYLLDADSDDQGKIRFFSLTHLANNPDVNGRDLRFYRAALAKVINSLSVRQDIVLPKSVPGTNDTVYAVNVEELGWTRRNLWTEVLKRYPYGLTYKYSQNDESLRKAAAQVELLSGTELAIVRGDWFIVNASQPPLYHTLLDIPTKLGDLEQRLGVDFEDAYERNDLKRAGFSVSGVSRQNRMIERIHSTNTDYYWISYDFKPRKARGDLFRFPLGPQFSGNRFNKVAFDHDGGEVIYHLPNGMQGYMLIDNKGNRIDRGPIDVVFDKASTLGTPEIINGISCMICHRHGMITEFRDEVRLSGTLGGIADKKVKLLYPKSEDMASTINRDRRKFLQSLEATIGPFLQVEEDRKSPIESFPEPVGLIASFYSRDLKPHEVALELGFEQSEDLLNAIRNNSELQRLGLGVLTQEPSGTLKREKWETLDGTSFFQDVAVEVKLGTPFVVGSITD